MNTTEINDSLKKSMGDEIKPWIMTTIYVLASCLGMAVLAYLFIRYCRPHPVSNDESITHRDNFSRAARSHRGAWMREQPNVISVNVANQPRTAAAAYRIQF